MNFAQQMCYNKAKIKKIKHKTVSNAHVARLEPPPRCLYRVVRMQYQHANRLRHGGYSQCPRLILKFIPWYTRIFDTVRFYS